ncbi:MAG: acyltransferase family protein [Nitrospira sp.]|nr:acyltransferase family protein [Nitrospira sp.]
METSSPASRNFQIAKVAGILTVATAHFFPGTILWVPSSIALFIFGFSSGYFTHLRYSERFDAIPYWRNKVLRLGYAVLVIDVFLLSVCSFTSSRSIWVWQTLLHLVGLGGVLDWLGIANESPLGGGMWFLTLLLGFYALYPLLRLVNRHEPSSSLLLVLALAVMGYCHVRYPMGYDLWPTAFSFLFGVYVAERPFSLPAWVYGLGGLVCVALMGSFNFMLRINSYNAVLIAVASVVCTLWLREATLPIWLVRPTSYLSDMVLEIYLIHTYLFFSFVGFKFADYFLSMGLVLSAAKLLQVTAVRVQKAANGSAVAV